MSAAFCKPRGARAAGPSRPPPSQFVARRDAKPDSPGPDFPLLCVGTIDGLPQPPGGEGKAPARFDDCDAGRRRFAKRGGQGGSGGTLGELTVEPTPFLSSLSGSPTSWRRRRRCRGLAHGQVVDGRDRTGLAGIAPLLRAGAASLSTLLCTSHGARLQQKILPFQRNKFMMQFFLGALIRLVYL